MKKVIFGVLSLLIMVVFLSGCVKEDVKIVDEEGNFVGEAFRSKAGRYKLNVSSAYKTRLTRASCDATGTLLEGETNYFVAKGKPYEIEASNFLYQAYAGGIHAVDFSVNSTVNRETFTLLEGESHTLADGGTIKLTSMLYQPYAGGIHSATFCLNGGVPACDELFTLLKGETHHLMYNGSLTLTSVLYQNYAGGIHSATLCFKK